MPITHEGYDGLFNLDSCNDIFIKTGSGAPIDGADGTGARFCGPGSDYVDYESGFWYIQAGTKDAPMWRRLL